MYKINEKISLPRIEIKMDEKIKEILKNFFNTISNTLTSLNNKNDEEKSLELISSMKEYLLDFALFLKELKEFQKEFSFFLVIRRMLNYVLDNYGSLCSSKRSVIFDSLFKFFELLRIKLSFLEGIYSKSSYLSYFNEFDTYLDEVKMEYYLNIYQRTGEFDDVIPRISQILLD